MRPDAHKKKASTQYKKKHGMAVDKKAPQARCDQRPTGPREDGEGKTALVVNVVGDEERKTPVATAAQSGDIVGVTVQSFRRRELASNWSRYEGLEEDFGVDCESKPSQLRGADFGLLLKVSSTSSSQFRFADELDWEDEASDVGAFLSVDCADLAAALQCEALHQRLGLTTDTFSVEQIRKFTAAAENHKVKYKRKVKETAGSTGSLEGSDIDLEDEDSDFESIGQPLDTDDKITTDCDTCPCPASIVVPKDRNKIDADVTTSETVSSAQSPVSSTTNLAKHTESPAEILPAKDNAEDDLDFLLSLEETVKIEPDDELQDQTESEAVAVPSPEPQHKPKHASPKPTTTNLEDWLDDFLDD